MFIEYAPEALKLIAIRNSSELRKIGPEASLPPLDEVDNFIGLRKSALPEF